MGNVLMPGDLHHVEMAHQIGSDIVARMGEAVAHARLGAEVDDPVKILPAQCLVERRMVGKIDFFEGESVTSQGGEPVFFQLHRIIIVEIIDPDNLLARARLAAHKHACQ